MSPAEARLKEVPSGMTDAEWNQRVNLAAAYRLVALYGWDDLVDTHISARVPGPEHHFLINPYGLMFDEITASSLVKVDLDGNQLTESDYSINPAGFTIHSAIHEVREDAGCVLHLHTPDGTAVASCMEGLLPMNQTAQLVTHDLAYHDYEGIALDHDERPRLQKDLGTKNHMLLRNHGTLTVGRSVASAFERMYHLERACTMQVRTRMLGTDGLSGRSRPWSTRTPHLFEQSRPRGIALDQPGMAAAAAQARPARPELPDLTPASGRTARKVQRRDYSGDRQFRPSRRGAGPHPAALSGVRPSASTFCPGAFTQRVGSITDRGFVRQCMKGVTAVLHAATLHKPHVATHSRQDFVDVNVTGTLNLLEEAAAAGVTAFVYTSTTSVFGDALVPPPGEPAAWVTEDVIPVPEKHLRRHQGGRRGSVPAVCAQPFTCLPIVLAHLALLSRGGRQSRHPRRAMPTPTSRPTSFSIAASISRTWSARICWPSATRRSTGFA